MNCRYVEVAEGIVSRGVEEVRLQFWCKPSKLMLAERHCQPSRHVVLNLSLELRQENVI